MGKKTISIKENNEGKFGAFARSLGMGVQEAARHVLANRDKFSSARVKQANFARNAAGWRKQDGGVVGNGEWRMGNGEMRDNSQFSIFNSQLGRMQEGGAVGSDDRGQMTDDSSVPVNGYGFARNNFFNRLFNRNNILEEQIRDEYGALKQIPLRKMHVDFANGEDAATMAQLHHNPEYIGPGIGVQPRQIGNVLIPKGKMMANLLAVDDSGYVPPVDADPKFVSVRYPGQYTTLINPSGLSKEKIKSLATNDFVSHALNGDPVYNNLSQELGRLLSEQLGDEDVRNNGGVDAYIRGLISDDPEYAVYREEMGFVPQALKDRIVTYVKSGKKVKRKQMGGDVKTDQAVAPGGSAPMQFTPFFRTLKEYQDYQRQFLKVADSALGEEDDKGFLKFTPYHRDYYLNDKDRNSKAAGYDCINGICGLDEAAGLRWSHPPDPDVKRYLSNKDFLKNIRAGKEDYVELNAQHDFNGPFAVGDHFLLLNDDGKPHHSMKLLNIERDKDGKPSRYRMIENDGYTKFHDQTVFTADELWDRFNRGPKGIIPDDRNDVVVVRPGRYLWDRTKPEERAAAEKKMEEDARRNYFVTHPFGSATFREGGMYVPKMTVGKQGNGEMRDRVVGGDTNNGGSQFSREGYKADSPDRFNAFNVIPSNQITMKGVPHPVMGVDNLGNRQLMLPGYEYVFPGRFVVERPAASYEPRATSGGTIESSFAKATEDRGGWGDNSQFSIFNSQFSRGGRYQMGGQSPQLYPFNPAGYKSVAPKVTDSMLPDSAGKRLLEQQVTEAQKMVPPPDVTDSTEYRAQNSPVSFQKQWLSNYVGSDKYRQRLMKEGFSAEDALREQQARMQNVKGVKLSFSDDFNAPPGTKTWGEYRGPSPPGEWWDNHSMSWKVISPQLFRNPAGEVRLLNEYRNGYTISNPALSTTPLHEHSHAVDAGGGRIPFATNWKIFDNTQQVGENSRRIDGLPFGYTNTPSEFLARMNVVRYMLNRQGIYDASKQDFDPNFYDAMMNNPTIRNNANFQQLFQTLKGNDAEKKQRFIELMNTIASSQEGNGSTVARYGGSVRNRVSEEGRNDGFTGVDFVFPGMARMQAGGSVVDYLNAVGQDSSIGSRKQLAKQLGIANYRGTAAQNLQLLDMLRSGDEDDVKGPAAGDTNTVPRRSVAPPRALKPADARSVHPRGDGFVNLKDYGIELYQDDGTYSPEALEFAKQVQMANPKTKVKFVCNESGCFAVANRASEGETGTRLYGQGAWENDGKTLWESPALQQYTRGSGEPLPNPKDYSIPQAIRQLGKGYYVGLNRPNNRVGDMATTKKEANDSYDYANNKLYPRSAGYEHIGYTLGDGLLLHGTGPGHGQPAHFVIDNMNDNDISLSGYGRYAPVEVLSTDRKASPLIPPSYAAPTQSKPGEQLRYGLKPNPDDNKTQRKAKERLISYFNNPELDQRLMSSTGMSKQDLEALKPVMLGILGNESSFNDISLLRNMKETGEAILRSNTSSGPLQVKYGSVPAKVSQEFGLESSGDFFDLDKAYPAAMAVLYDSYNKVNNAVAKGIQPGLANMNPYWRAAYDYNMPLLSEKGDEQIEQLWQDKTGGKGTAAEKQKFFEQMRLRGDIGSYPYKAMQHSSDLITEVMRANQAQNQGVAGTPLQAQQVPWALPVVQTAPVAVARKRSRPGNQPVAAVPTATAMLPRTGFGFFEAGGMVEGREREREREWYQDGGQPRRVNVIDKEYKPLGKKDGKDLFYKDADVALPMATGTGEGGPEYEAYLRAQLAAGVSPDELVRTKRISRDMIPQYAKFFMPRRDIVYTDAPAPAPTPAARPFTGFSGSELYNPQQHLAGMYNFKTRYSPTAADAGTLNSSQQVADLMFVDRMGKVDTARGRYEIPADVFSNQMTNGVKTLRDTTGLSQYRVPVTGGLSYQPGGQYDAVTPFGLPPFASPNFTPPYAQPLVPRGASASAPFQMNNDMLSTYLAGQHPGFQQFMQQQQVMSKDNSIPIGMRDDTNLDTEAILYAGQNKGLRDFLHKPKILSKDSTKLMDDTNPPAVSKTTHSWGPNVGAATGLVAGMSFLNKNVLGARDENRYKNWLRFRNLGDNKGPLLPADLETGRGDYTVNEGYFRPQRYVPTQFGAVPAAQMGGGYYDAPMEVQPAEGLPQAEGPVASNEFVDPFAHIGAALEANAGRVAIPNRIQVQPEEKDKRSTVRIPEIQANNRVRPNATAWEAYNYYVTEKGMEPHIAAGIVGNLYRESGLQTDAEEKGNTAEGRGIAQWDVNGRWKGLHKWAESRQRDPLALQTQLDYILEEPGEGAKVMEALAKARTPEEASYVFGKVYERPLDKKNLPDSKNPARWDIRAGVARKLFEGERAASGKLQAARGGEFFYKEGGEYEVSEEQLRRILAMGGEVEFL